MCGCNKNRARVQSPARSASERVAAAKAADEVAMYDLYDADGNLAGSYTNPVTAREQARQIGGTVAPPRTGGTAAPTLPGTPPAENPTPDAVLVSGH